MNLFKNILYVAEASVSQAAAIARAVSLAANNQATLTVVDVVSMKAADLGLPAGGPISTELQAAIKANHLQALESLVEPYRQDINIQLKVLSGKTFLEVIREVLRNSYDLVIKPAENPCWVDRLFGSNDMHLLRKCPCPVWLMQPAEKTNYECILAAVDFDLEQPDSVAQGLNKEILELSSSLALSDFAALHLLHAWNAPVAEFVALWSNNPKETSASLEAIEASRHQDGMEQLRQQLLDQLGQEAYEYLSPYFHLQQGQAKIIIPEWVSKLRADLVVMGTLARSGTSGLFIGNTAEAILDQLKCSVLAIKPPGFVSPVTLDE